MTGKRVRYDSVEEDLEVLDVEEGAASENSYERHRNAIMATNRARMQPALDAAKIL